MVRYAALRFAEDENIADRTYWYRCPLAVREGERVFAPVGAHDRIQRAQVERILETDEAHAPYDVRFLKNVAAKCGAYRVKAGEDLLFEAGGVPYDGKHYTRFGRVLFGDCTGAVRGAQPLAADNALQALRAFPADGACVVFTGGQGARAAAYLMLLAGAKEGDVRARLALCGAREQFPEEGAAALARCIPEGELARLAGILR